jgi:hypothetical protein
MRTRRRATLPVLFWLAITGREGVKAFLVAELGADLGMAQAQ